MDLESIKLKKEEIISKFGPWTAHNIQLADDLYTIDKRIVGDEIKLRRIVQIVSDIAGKPLEKLRILDLACLEGLYAIEFARRGSQVVGIEGREANIEKARFVKEVLSLDNCEFYQDDVRNLSLKKYGSFDVVLCLGILYHLDAPDVFYFLERIAEVCRKFTIIDTHISLSARKPFFYNGRNYWGKTFREHNPRSSLESRKKALWASLDNVQSFWLTASSLYNLLLAVGFSSAYECQNPPEPKKPKDRVTILAIKGSRQQLISTPLVNELPQNWPEKRSLFRFPFYR